MCKSKCYQKHFKHHSSAPLGFLAAVLQKAMEELFTAHPSPVSHQKKALQEWGDGKTEKPQWGEDDRDKNKVWYWLTNTTQSFNGTAHSARARYQPGASLQERQRKMPLLTHETHTCFVFPLFSLQNQAPGRAIVTNCTTQLTSSLVVHFISAPGRLILTQKFNCCSASVSNSPPVY